jgi:broad specificity phosphatase PhoE
MSLAPFTPISAASTEDVGSVSTPLVWKRIANISQDLAHGKKPTPQQNDGTVVATQQQESEKPLPSTDLYLWDDDDDPCSPNSDYHDVGYDVYNVPPSDLGPRYFRDVEQGGQKTLLVIMVGLPARGKTFLAQKLCRLLSWQGYKAQVYNSQVAWKRRLRAMKRQTTTASSSSSSPTSAVMRTGLSPVSCDTCGDDSMLGSVPALSSLFPESEPQLPASPTVRIVNAASTYRELYECPESMARQAYVAVLHDLAESARSFFANESYSGNVVILNDDFATAELRNIAEELIGVHAARTVYVEVQREADEKKNSLFSTLKATDPAEYMMSASTSVFPDSPPSQGPSPSAVPPVADLDPVLLKRKDADNSAPLQQEERKPAAAAASSSSPMGDARFPAVNSDNAMLDFNLRIANIERVYETMRPESNKSYIKLTDASLLEIHKVSGFLCSRVVSFLMNLSQHKIQHPIYFVRHGQSMYNLDDRLGGNPDLTPKGHVDAAALCSFLARLKEEEKRRGVENEMQIWTSQLRRAIQTAEPAERKLGIPCLRWSSLNEIHAGVCENMTYKEVEQTYPLIHRFRSESKYTFRYPEGESYQDLVVRLEPVIMELENANRVVVVVAHQAVLRALLAYFGGTPAESAVYVEVPHRCVWRCSYNMSGSSSLDVLKLGTPSVGDGRKD